MEFKNFLKNIVIFSLFYAVIFFVMIPWFSQRFLTVVFYQDLASSNPIFNWSFQLNAYFVILGLYTLNFLIRRYKKL